MKIKPYTKGMKILWGPKKSYANLTRNIEFDALKQYKNDQISKLNKKINRARNFTVRVFNDNYGGFKTK